MKETKHHPLPYRRRFRYFEYSIKRKVFYERHTRLWWMPAIFVGRRVSYFVYKLRPLIGYDAWWYACWWIRRNILYT